MLMSFPEGLHAIGFKLKPQEYTWLTRSGFDIYSYEWDDAGINTMVRKAVIARKRSSNFWRVGCGVAILGYATANIAFEAGAESLAYGAIVPTVAGALSALVGGLVSSGIAEGRVKKAAQKRPHSFTR